MSAAGSPFMIATSSQKRAPRGSNFTLMWARIAAGSSWPAAAAIVDVKRSTIAAPSSDVGESPRVRAGRTRASTPENLSRNSA